MKAGNRVKLIKNDRVGTSKGPVHRYGVDWILVTWDDNGESIVLERVLELINEPP